MNFALIVDACKVESYTVIENKAYKFREPTVPYQFHHSIKNESFIGFWGYPFVFGGDFLNWSEWEKPLELPDRDYDLIFVVIERNFGHSIDELRKKYPNAIIVSLLKETYNWNSEWMRRMPIYDQADHVFIPVSHRELFPGLTACKKPVDFLGQPVDAEYLYNNFYSNKRDELIFPYFAVHNQSRFGRTWEFTFNMSKKYALQYIKPLHTQDSPNQWHDFLKEWSRATFHFNLDPIPHFPGQQAMQCAALGVVHIGGLNDSHGLIWQETATNDESVLEEQFDFYLNNIKERMALLQRAWDRMISIYSYDAVRNRTKELLNL